MPRLLGCVYKFGSSSMRVSGWGNYPSIEAIINNPLCNKEILEQLHTKQSVIARGLGRSYGDSALASRLISTKHLDRFIHFDESSGLLTCQSGLSLASILEFFVPKGWFLKVTPGTKFVTVGGAIASDVHGKNHHLDGCFSECVIALKIATVSQDIVECSREQNAELFFATCGGMGLTGIILEATFKLLPIQSSYIEQTTLKAENIQEALVLFKEHQMAHYSVAWVDCLATGNQLGRSLIMLGEHAKQGSLVLKPKTRLSMPFNMPNGLLNAYSIKAFNAYYYQRIRQQKSKQLVDYESFFYPLDGIENWNRMYGKKGFCQYQFVLPKAAGLEGMTEIVKTIAESKRGSFLAVLKAFGKQNKNYLSFPIEGYTLALDFKREPGLFELLDELDQKVLAYGGRIYLTKDSRMSKVMFQQSYASLDKFIKVRQNYEANQRFNSFQSQRLGI